MRRFVLILVLPTLVGGCGAAVVGRAGTVCPSPPIAWAPPTTATESVARLSASISHAMTHAGCTADRRALERREVEHREVERPRIAARRVAHLAPQRPSASPPARTASAPRPSAPPPNPFETPPPNPFE